MCKYKKKYVLCNFWGCKQPLFFGQTNTYLILIKLGETCAFLFQQTNRFKRILLSTCNYFPLIIFPSFFCKDSQCQLAVSLHDVKQNFENIISNN